MVICFIWPAALDFKTWVLALRSLQIFKLVRDSRIKRAQNEVDDYDKPHAFSRPETGKMAIACHINYNIEPFSLRNLL